MTLNEPQSDIRFSPISLCEMLATRDDFAIPYPVATIGVEKSNKQSMFQDATTVV
jgi:hypothetical protein